MAAYGSRVVPFHLWKFNSCCTHVHCRRQRAQRDLLQVLMASKYEEKKEFRDVSHPNSTQPDVVAIRLEVDDLCPLSPAVQELAFNSSSNDQQSEGGERDIATTSKH